MGNDHNRTSDETPSSRWDEIVSSVELLAGKAKSGMSAPEFHNLVLEKALAATNCDSGRVWIRVDSWSFKSKEIRSSPTHNDWTLSASVSRELQRPVPQIEFDEENFEQTCSNNEINRTTRSDRCIWRLPVGIEDDPVAVIELISGVNSTSEQQQGTEQFLTVIGDLVADHALFVLFRMLKAQERYRHELDLFLKMVHQSLRVEHVAFVTVNLGLKITGGDRMTLLLANRKSMRVIAVSGIDTFNPRSQRIVDIQKEAALHLANPQSFWTESSSASNNLQTDIAPSPAAGPVVHTTPAIVCHVPLKQTAEDGKSVGETIGMLRVEWFDEVEQTQRKIMETRVDWVALYASQALANAIVANSSSLFGIKNPFTNSAARRRSISVGVAAGAVALLVFALVFIKADLKIEARGTLQPVTREVIFAPRSATVSDFPIIQHEVDPSEIQVLPGDVVIQLDSPELQYELTTLLGEQAAVVQQLDSTSVTLSQLGGLGSNANGSQERFDELTTTLLELRIRSQSLTERIELLKKEQQKLSLKAPIEGRIVTWDFTRKLRGRPVSQGDRLLEIVDTEGQWQLELYVPDHHFGYVSDAVNSSPKPVAISFIERSNPAVEHTGEVVTLARSTEMVAEHGATVQLIGRVHKTQVSDAFRPGTTLIAEINCGKRSLGFVWLHDLWETIRMKLLF